MKRSEDRILTTHAGSLVRTPGIIRAMKALDEGKPYDEQTYREDLRNGVADVVQRQAEAGIDVVSDGEYGKRGWSQYVIERFTGLEPERREELRTFMDRGPRDSGFVDFWSRYRKLETVIWLPEPAFGDAVKAGKLGPGLPQTAWVCTGPVTYRGHDAVARDIENFKAALGAADVVEAFMPVVAPCSAEVTRENRYYDSEEDYLSAVATALSEEYRAIVNAGLLLQVDDAHLPMRFSAMAAQGRADEWERWAAMRVDALNAALEGIPSDRVRYHICWGSQNAPHLDDAPLRVVINQVMRVNADAYVIESANPRHEHEWTVWEDVKLPPGKTLIAGVVSHATNIVEHPDLIATRLERFARALGRENVMAGTDCGFSQNWNLIRVHPSVQWAKLEALAQGAEIASRRLWGG
ncbi:MAG: cobalamin-independent methionine synthase II family protein [Chloroflexota bacterium]|nr:cobalamin-independent methionine synthase II family protein [Chloroflexota bacterium]MDE2885411.1 cobalamin-independent methionine synthase II family protein [Chloroflexota bacterium]